MPPGPSFRRRGVIDGTIVTAELAGLSLLRGRRGVGLALLCSLPLLPVLFGFLRDESGVKGALGFVETITTFYFRLVNPLVFLFVGCGAVGEEIEGRTLPYLLTRPVPRSALLLGRWAAGIVNGLALLASAYIVTYLVTVGQMGTEALLVDLPALAHALFGLLLSAVGYTAFFLFLSVIVKWPLLIGLGLYAWETFAAAMPGTAARWSLQHHVYVLLTHWTGEERYRALASPYRDPLLPASDSLLVLFWFSFASLSLAILRFRRRPYLV